MVRTLCLVAVAIFCLAVPASASYHTMQIEGVTGGVGGDTNQQAIQLRMRTNGQNFLNTGIPNGPAKLMAYDSTGSNPVNLITFPSNVANGLTGNRVLITSAGFPTSPAVAPDFTLSNLIPASYLPAGRLTFESSAAEIWWSIAWGGAGYSGSTSGQFLNDADGDFGKLAGALSSGGLSAVFFTGAAGDLSTTNSSDYSLTTGAGVWTNNAGSTFTETPEPATMLLVGTGLVGLVGFLRRKRA